MGDDSKTTPPEYPVEGVFDLELAASIRSRTTRDTYAERLARAERFVRDELVIFGQHADAEDAAFVRHIAMRVMASIGAGRVKVGGKLPW